mgnify:CR=1 FL=1
MIKFVPLKVLSMFNTVSHRDQNIPPPLLYSLCPKKRINLVTVSIDYYYFNIEY